MSKVRTACFGGPLDGQFYVERPVWYKLMQLYVGHGDDGALYEWLYVYKRLNPSRLDRSILIDAAIQEETNVG